MKQGELLCDIFDLYFCEHVKKMNSNSEEVAQCEDVFLYRLCDQLANNGDRLKVTKLLTVIVTHCISP